MQQRALFRVGVLLYLVAFACPVSPEMRGYQAAVYVCAMLFVPESVSFFLYALFVNLANVAVLLVAMHYLGGARSREMKALGALGLVSAAYWALGFDVGENAHTNWTELGIGYWLWLAGQVCIYIAYVRLPVPPRRNERAGSAP
jgi:hypothetical protein